VPAAAPLRRPTAGPLLSPRLIAAVATLAFVLTVGGALGVALALRHLKKLVDERGAREDQTAPASAAPAASTARTSEVAPHAHALSTETQTTRIGSIELVTLGSAAPELRGALRDELGRSRTTGLNLLVAVMDGDDCEPCLGFLSSLSAPEMQSALRGARLLVLERATFKEELDELGLRTDVQPMFLRFDESLGLLDAIHGGEWADDVAINIAPVLGAFSRGAYRARRYPIWTPARGGQRL